VIPLTFHLQDSFDSYNFRMGLSVSEKKSSGILIKKAFEWVDQLGILAILSLIQVFPLI
jgi:hypothetical protein